LHLGGKFKNEEYRKEAGDWCFFVMNECLKIRHSAGDGLILVLESEFPGSFPQVFDIDCKEAG